MFEREETLDQAHRQSNELFCDLSEGHKRELNEKDEEIRVLRESMSMMKKDFLELQDRMRAGEAILDEWKSTVEKTQHDIQQVRREKMELKARVAGCEALLKSNEEQIALLKSAKEDAEKKQRDLTHDHEYLNGQCEALRKENVRLKAPTFQPPGSHTHKITTEERIP